MLYPLVEGRKDVHCLHFDFLIDWGLRKINLAIRLTQQQCLFANAIVPLPNDAIFIKTSMKNKNLKNRKEIDTRRKNDLCRDDKLMFF